MIHFYTTFKVNIWFVDPEVSLVPKLAVDKPITNRTDKYYCTCTTQPYGAGACDESDIDAATYYGIYSSSGTKAPTYVDDTRSP